MFVKTELVISKFHCNGMSYLNNGLRPGSCVVEVGEVDALAVAALVVAAVASISHITDCLTTLLQSETVF